MSLVPHDLEVGPADDGRPGPFPSIWSICRYSVVLVGHSILSSDNRNEKNKMV